MLVVGAGLGGLVCARRLLQAGIDVTILDSSDRPGGRVKTDLVDGFLLDRGFQVAFTAYPDLCAELDVEQLGYCAFENGALIASGGKLSLVSKDRPLASALGPTMGIADKLRATGFSGTLAKQPPHDDETAGAYLERTGFSPLFMQNFARPFFGGIFLDRSLGVSAKQFAFVWKMLDAGSTVVPAKGMEAIPGQIAKDIPKTNFQLGTEAKSLLKEGENVVGVSCSAGDLKADAVILATESDVAARLAGLDLITESKSSTCFWFETPGPIGEGKLLILNAQTDPFVGHIAPLSAVNPAYAPSGRHLVAATALGLHEGTDEALAERAIRNIGEWLPGGAKGWRLLRVDRIRFAQMAQPAGFEKRIPPVNPAPGLFLAGEFASDSSLNGAAKAGRLAAEAVLAAR